MPEIRRAVTRLAPVTPFASSLAQLPRRSGAGITVRELTGLGIANVAVRKGKHGALATALAASRGIELVDAPRVSAGGGISCIGTGPGNWLALEQGAGSDFARRLAQEVDGLASVCDQSSGYGVLRLSGPEVRRLLAKGVPIDLHPEVFRPGDAAVTLASHIGTVLWREGSQDESGGEGGEDAFCLAVFRSYADSFWHWLGENAAEFGLCAA